MTRKNKFLLTLLFLLLTTVRISFTPASAQSADPNELNQLTVYTAMTATTAQLPLLGALNQGWPELAQSSLNQKPRVTIEYWKNLEDLRALVLAGQGDVWVGHLETLARAANRGAPVCLVAVTVWRKFYFVSAPIPLGQDGAIDYPQDVASLLKSAVVNQIIVTSSPKNSPQQGFLERLKTVQGDFPTDSLPPQQLILELARGQRLIGLLPEPMASLAVVKNPKLKIIGSLEEEYASNFGGPGLIPQDGVAVNLKLANQNPELVSELLRAMTETVESLKGQEVSKLMALFPPEVIEAVGPEVLEASLNREPLLIKSATEARAQIEEFLNQAAPEILENNSRLPPSFIWESDRPLTQ